MAKVLFTFDMCSSYSKNTEMHVLSSFMKYEDENIMNIVFLINLTARHLYCLIPMNRSYLSELVKLVERTVKSENRQSPDTPIYLVGQSFGACLALVVAARNPEIDLILVLANSGENW